MVFNNIISFINKIYRIFTRPFIVDPLSEGKPMINTVLKYIMK